MVLTKTNRNLSLRLCAMRSSAVEREKKYPLQSWSIFLFVDLISHMHSESKSDLISMF